MQVNLKDNISVVGFRSFIQSIRFSDHKLQQAKTQDSTVFNGRSLCSVIFILILKVCLSSMHYFSLSKFYL